MGKVISHARSPFCATQGKAGNDARIIVIKADMKKGAHEPPRLPIKARFAHKKSMRNYLYLKRNFLHAPKHAGLGRMIIPGGRKLNLMLEI